jgi:hypothetical protein
MEVLQDVAKHKDIALKIISSNAHEAEHNLYCYLYNVEPGSEDFLFVFEQDMKKYGILARQDKSEWIVFSGILAPDTKALFFLEEFLDYAFSKGAKKVVVEFETGFRKNLIKYLKNTNYRACAINYTLTWPVFEMKTWNGELMQGKDWKDMRYYWNKFFKNHKVEFKNHTEVSKESLKELIFEWKKTRNGKDKAYENYYLNAVNNDFIGYDNVRIMVVDGKVAALTAGFRVPMKDKNYYYSSIGIVSKEFDRAGEIANMDDLIELKKKGYEFVDFGGGEKALTDFKQKFKPTYFYKTHIFSIVRKHV